MMIMKTTIEAYLSENRSRGLSFETIIQRFYSLTKFQNWCQRNKIEDLSSITQNNLKDYQEWIQNLGLQAKTVRTRLLDIRLFFNWCKKTCRIFDNPAKDWTLGKQSDYRLPDVLTETEIGRLLNAPNLSSPMGIRNKAILEVFYSTGIRRMELKRLKLNQVSFNDGIVIIEEGKGHKSRLVPIGKEALSWTKTYFRHSYSFHRSRKDLPVFLNRTGDPLGNGVLRTMIKKLKLKTGINKRGCCHLIRHSMATHMLKNGADLRIIQEILGHTKIDTTLIYTHLDIQHLKKVHQQTHPEEQNACKKLLF